MKKNLKQIWQDHRLLLILTSAIILLQMLVGAALWDKLPDEIATHFDFEGTPNGWSSKVFTVFGMPLILLALHWVCILAGCSPEAMTKQTTRKLRPLLLMIVPAVSLLAMITCYGYALGERLNVTRMSLIFVGLVFAITGNYMPKIRRNHTTGIKLPWTMADEENWNKTHRMAAPVWVICGLLIVVMGLIGQSAWIAPAAIVAAVLLPTVYSFALHLKKKNQ